ncbi:HAD family hydrolase [Streptomyces decoyicus]|uniref:hypothetical protein n=1 Tax=Streptomyces decoyicus TaxID=249567 RepID=UPI00365A5ED6
MARLALFDLDGTLVDRQSAFSDAVTHLCRANAFDHDVEQWLLTELADRANPDDLARLRAVFNLKAPRVQVSIKVDVWPNMPDPLDNKIALLEQRISDTAGNRPGPVADDM